MRTSIPASTRAAGFWSAALATVFSLAYVVGQLAEWAGWLGSQGGPESASTPFGIVVLLTPSLLLGSSFLVLTISIQHVAAPERRVWGHAAAAFATIYATLISTVYFVQLTLVAPRLADGRVGGIEMFLFVPFDSFLYAVDILGYSFMSVSTLFAAAIFPGRGLERLVRTCLIANGLLLPFIALQMYFHDLIWIAALWAVTFPGATGSLAWFFWSSVPSVSRSGRVPEHDQHHARRLDGVNGMRDVGWHQDNRLRCGVNLHAADREDEAAGQRYRQGIERRRVL